MTTPADRNYRNARRAGGTHPDMVEMIERNNPRHSSQQYDKGRPNRAMRRRNGYTRGANRSRRRSPRKADGLHPLSMRQLAADRARTLLDQAAA